MRIGRTGPGLWFKRSVWVGYAAVVITVLGCGGNPTATNSTDVIGTVSPLATPALLASPSQPPASMTALAQATATVAATLGHGQISSTGPMVVARNGQSATLLLDGRVLIVGGTADRSAELYDPATGTFSLTGSMAESQPGATATLLRDGRVLIAGGTDGSLYENPVASAELYDPKTGIFSPTGSMTTARFTHTATLLSGGRVLIVGDEDRSFDAKPSAEFYDPSTGTFAPTGSPAKVRAGNTATLLSDGRVLIAGGTGTGAYNDSTAASAELYDPTIGKFALTGSMTTSRWSGHTGTLLSDGRVLIVGGNASSVQEVPLTSAELYNPKTGKFSATGSMSVARDAQSAILLHDGRVLVWEGALGSPELYDPTTGQFTRTGSAMPFGGGQTATLLADGRVLITGGWDGVSVSNLSNSAELFQP
jgi:hypothetical protein